MTTIRAAALPRAVPCGRVCVRTPETRAVFAPRPSQSAHVANAGRRLRRLCQSSAGRIPDRLRDARRETQVPRARTRRRRRR